MPKPTGWKPARDGRSATRTTSSGNTLHRQYTPSGYVEHINRPGKPTERLPSQTTDPTNTRKPH